MTSRGDVTCDVGGMWAVLSMEERASTAFTDLRKEAMCSYAWQTDDGKKLVRSMYHIPDNSFLPWIQVNVR